MDENTVQETVSATTNAVATTSGMSGKTKIIIAASAAAAGLGAGVFFLIRKICAKKKATVEVSEEK